MDDVTRSKRIWRRNMEVNGSDTRSRTPGRVETVKGLGVLEGHELEATWQCNVHQRLDRLAYFGNAEASTLYLRHASPFSLSSAPSLPVSLPVSHLYASWSSSLSS